MARAPVEEHEQQRPGDVELFLDTERPQVQQRAELRGGIKVTRFAPEKDIGEKPDTGERLPAELLVLVWKQQYGAADQGRRQNSDERREDSPDTPRVEAPIGEPALAQRLEN